MKKNIGIDISHYNKLSGYWVVTNNILYGLLKNDNYNFFLLSNRDITLPKEFKKPNIHIIISKQPYYFYRLFYQYFLLKKYKIDTFLSFDQIVPLLKSCKYTAIVHDLDNQQRYTWRNAKYFWWIKNYPAFFYFLINIDKILAKFYDKIICPSEYTKQQIIHFFKKKEKDITVTNRWMDHLKRYNENYKKQDYIIFPSYNHIYDFFLKTLAKEILDQWIIKSVIFRKAPKIDFWDTRIHNITKWCTDEEREKMFSEAKAAIYISDGEWFGFVPLELAFCKTPVIYYNRFCLQEIFGDIWIPFEKLDNKEIINQLRHLLWNTIEYNKKIETWIKKIHKFSWLWTIQKILLNITE